MGTYSEVREYPIGFDQAFNGILDTLYSIHMNVKEQSRSEGIIKASTGMNVFSWGENILINISRVSYGTSVYVESESRAQLFDYVRNQQNVMQIIAKLNKRFS